MDDLEKFLAEKAAREEDARKKAVMQEEEEKKKAIELEEENRRADIEMEEFEKQQEEIVQAAIAKNEEIRKAAQKEAAIKIDTSIKKEIGLEEAIKKTKEAREREKENEKKETQFVEKTELKDTEEFLTEEDVKKRNKTRHEGALRTPWSEGIGLKLDKDNPDSERVKTNEKIRLNGSLGDQEKPGKPGKEDKYLTQSMKDALKNYYREMGTKAIDMEGNPCVLEVGTEAKIVGISNKEGLDKQILIETEDKKRYLIDRKSEGIEFAYARKIEIEDFDQVFKDEENRLSRKDGPAAIKRDGFQLYYKDGKLHREDGPAVVRPNGDQEWYKNGELHREGGPAITRKGGKETEWYKNGELHREDGPAIESSNPNGCWETKKEWFQNGLPFREDGPIFEGSYKGFDQKMVYIKSYRNGLYGMDVTQSGSERSEKMTMRSEVFDQHKTEEEKKSTPGTYLSIQEKDSGKAREAIQQVLEKEAKRTGVKIDPIIKSADSEKKYPDRNWNEITDKQFAHKMRAQELVGVSQEKSVGKKLEEEREREI